MSVAQQLQEVRRRVGTAAEAAGRKAESVGLIAVSKRQSTAAIREAYAAGQRDFGENYLQELAEKQDELVDCPDIRWHFIGHLQSRKAKEAVQRNAWIHGVASLSGIQRLSAAAGPAGITIPVFLQINLAGEASKSGASPGDAESFAAALASAPHLDWRGLMAIPPVSEDVGETRAYFRSLRVLRDQLVGTFPQCRGELSMGMSQDFESAIAEGANWVRVGTAIFGRRPAP